MDFENIPIQPTPQGYATPDQIDRQRKIAQLLMMGSGQQQKPTHPAQLFGNLANSAVGNMQLNQANSLDRSSDLQDAGQFAEGMQQPQQAPQVDHVKNEASRFALLAQKYSGKPIGAAISEWKKGEGGAPYAQFVSGRTGLDPSTPITPELLRGPQGHALVKAMADWDAGGRAPITDQQLMQAQQMAFGGPQTGGGEGGDEGGQTLGFSGEPAESGGNDAMGGIVSALQAPKTGAVLPVPGGPVTRAPLEGAAPPGSGIDAIPSSVLPHRIPMTREALINTLASRRLDPAIKQTALKLYMEQSQPMQMEAPGGVISIGADNKRQFFPKLFTGDLKTGDTTFPTGWTFTPDFKSGGVNQNFAGEGGGGGSGGAPGGGGASPAPGGGPYPALGNAPPSGGGPTEPQTSQSVIPSKMRQVTDYGLQSGRAKEFSTKDVDTLFKEKEKQNANAESAARGISSLQALHKMVLDPRMYQGIGAQFVQDWERVKAAFGGDPAKASIMQAFDKFVSGDIISTLRAEYGGLGQIRNKEIELSEKAMASKYNTTPANLAVIDIQIKARQQLVELARVANNYLAGFKLDKDGNPVLGPDGRPVKVGTGQITSSGLNDAKLNYIHSHPIFKQSEIDDYTKRFDEDGQYNPKKVEGAGAKKSDFRNPQPVLPTTPPPSPAELEMRRRGLIK